MIKYTLKCENEHEFESWFSNGHSFVQQQEKNLIACPFCDSHQVAPALMAPNVHSRKLIDTPKKPIENKQKTPTQKPAIATPPPSPTTADNASIQQLEFARALREYVHHHSENVGENFAEEARKMHYEEIETRPISGETSLDEARDLIEEGISIIPLPRLPEDLN